MHLLQVLHLPGFFPVDVSAFPVVTTKNDSKHFQMTLGRQNCSVTLHAHIPDLHDQTIKHVISDI